MKRFYLLSFLLLLSCIAAAAQSSPATTITYIEIDGKEYKKGLKVLLYEGDTKLEAPLSKRSFSLPSAFQKKGKIGVKVIFGVYKLDFGYLPKDYFQETWDIRIDHKPFEAENLRGADPNEIKYIFSLSLWNGGQLLYTVRPERIYLSNHINNKKDIIL